MIAKEFFHRLRTYIYLSFESIYKIIKVLFIGHLFRYTTHLLKPSEFIFPVINIDPCEDHTMEFIKSTIKFDYYCPRTMIILNSYKYPRSYVWQGSNSCQTGSGVIVRDIYVS